MVDSDWLAPDWAAPARVGALMTTRSAGMSAGPYASMNLGDHVGDAPEAVAANRAIVAARTGATPRWLTQVHGLEVVDAARIEDGAAADALVCRRPGIACAIMTADCLPVLLCDRDGTVVAAAHAGWRGLCGGVLEAAVRAMAVAPERIVAWLGAAIGPSAFEVGDEVRAAFMAADVAALDAFVPGGSAGKWQADLYLLARQRLARAGVASVTGGGLCTHTDAARFFSYRRDGTTGRMAALIWLAAGGKADAY